jgi:bifunctional non-homologous end joining protein LigD
LEGSLKDLIQSVKVQGLEGLVANRRDSVYEAGERSGAWQKMRINQGQEFVIGGYTVGGTTFDAMVFGYYVGTASYMRRAHGTDLRRSFERS